MRTPVAILLALTLAGCVQPGGVHAPISPSAGNVASNNQTNAPTSQPATLTTGAVQGEGNTVTPIAATLSGSAWAAVAVAALFIAGLVAVAYVVTANRKRIIEDNAAAIAASIKDMGPGTQRDQLLDRIGCAAPHQAELKRFVARRGVRVKRE